MEIQLEFNFEGRSKEEMTLYLMQKEIVKIFESTEKVRKRLFAELGELKKGFAVLQKDNEDLKSKLTEIQNGKNGKTEWTYRENGLLFDVRKYQEAAG